MSHNVSGIVTAFKYQGALPHHYLIGNVTFIPMDSRHAPFKGYPEAPFDELTVLIKRQAHELSFHGRCAYIETDFFGGEGTQMALLWEMGQAAKRALVSFHNLARFSSAERSMPVSVVKGAINLALQHVGVIKHEGKDEFDTAHLNDFGSNAELLDQIAAAAKRK